MICHVYQNLTTENAQYVYGHLKLIVPFAFTVACTNDCCPVARSVHDTYTIEFAVSMIFVKDIEIIPGVASLTEDVVTSCAFETSIFDERFPQTKLICDAVMLGSRIGTRVTAPTDPSVPETTAIALPAVSVEAPATGV